MKSSVLGTLRKITFKRTQSHSLIALSIILFVFEMDCDILFFIDKKTVATHHSVIFKFIFSEINFLIYKKELRRIISNLGMII